MVEKTLLYGEIQEQPQVLRQLLEEEIDAIRRLASAICERGIRQMVIAARGTSDNAARYAQYLFGSMNGLIVSLATPSLYTIYHQPPSLKEALVLGISQSGSSPDVIQVLLEGKRQGALTAAFTNTIGSSLAQEADYVINLRAGEERSLAATKTYTCELTALALLSAQMAEDASMLQALKQVPEWVAFTLSANEHIPSFVHRFQGMEYCVVLGRGYNLATAFDFALKLMELTHVVSEAYSSADFFHGPLTVIERGFPAFVISPSGPMMTEMNRTMSALRARGAVTVAVSDQQEFLDLADFRLVMPPLVPEWLTPIPAIVPGQLFAMHLGYVRGLDVDRPRGLRKVTETW